MTHTKYQKYVFGLKSSHLKIGGNGAGAYTMYTMYTSKCVLGTLGPSDQVAVRDAFRGSSKSRTLEGPEYCRVVCYLKEIQIVL